MNLADKRRSRSLALSGWRDGVDGGLGCHREVQADIDALYLDDRQGVLAGLHMELRSLSGVVTAGLSQKVSGRRLMDRLCPSRRSLPAGQLLDLVWRQARREFLQLALQVADAAFRRFGGTPLAPELGFRGFQFGCDAFGLGLSLPGFGGPRPSSGDYTSADAAGGAFYDCGVPLAVLARLSIPDEVLTGEGQFPFVFFAGIRRRRGREELAEPFDLSRAQRRGRATGQAVPCPLALDGAAAGVAVTVPLPECLVGLLVCSFLLLCHLQGGRPGAETVQPGLATRSARFPRLEFLPAQVRSVALPLPPEFFAAPVSFLRGKGLITRSR